MRSGQLDLVLSHTAVVVGTAVIVVEVDSVVDVRWGPHLSQHVAAEKKKTMKK